MSIRDILTELKKPFPAADHQERQLPGGGRWLFVPWQKIRDRLDDVCPGWGVVYSDPVSCDGLTVVRCRLTIDGVSREGIGNSDNGKGYGTPVERATADAFKNAAEAFGVGAYLDNQDFVVRYLQSQGDGRGVQFTQRDRKRPTSSGKQDGLYPTVSRGKPAPALAPEGNGYQVRARSLCQMTELSWEIAAELSDRHLKKSLMELSTMDEVLKLRNALLIQWAQSKHQIEEKEAKSLYKLFWGDGARKNQSDANLMRDWESAVQKEKIAAARGYLGYGNTAELNKILAMETSRCH